MCEVFGGFQGFEGFGGPILRVEELRVQEFRAWGVFERFEGFRGFRFQGLGF